MKYISVFAILLLSLLSANISGNSWKDYLKDRYPVRVVSGFSHANHNRIVIISSRNFKSNTDLVIKRGLDPRYRLSLFIAELRNDTALLLPLGRFEEISDYLPAERNVLVLVDGHGKTFGQSIERGFDLSHRFNITMVVFDWPTDNLTLRKTVNNSSDAAVSFVNAMRKLNELKQESFPDAAVSVLFHSMGNRIIKEISGKQILEKMPARLFSNIIINAAAVKQQNHKKWVEKLNIQKRIFITMNDQDYTLRGAAILRMSKQLGLTNKDKTAKNAHYVNFSQLSSVEHNMFLGKSLLEKTNPEIQIFYDLVFHGQEVILEKPAGFQILRPSDKSFLFSER